MVTEIQQGLLVKQDYRLHRVAGDLQQGYWFRELPAPECCRFRSVTGSGVLPVTEESVPILKGKKPAPNPVLTTGLPVTETCRFRSVAGSGTVVLLVTRNLLFPSLLARKQLQIQC